MIRFPKLLRRHLFSVKKVPRSAPNNHQLHKPEYHHLKRIEFSVMLTIFVDASNSTHRRPITYGNAEKYHHERNSVELSTSECTAADIEHSHDGYAHKYGVVHNIPNYRYSCVACHIATKVHESAVVVRYVSIGTQSQVTTKIDQTEKRDDENGTGFHQRSAVHYPTVAVTIAHHD